jgi:hypothetical protein
VDAPRLASIPAICSPSLASSPLARRLLLASDTTFTFVLARAPPIGLLAVYAGGTRLGVGGCADVASVWQQCAVDGERLCHPRMATAAHSFLFPLCRHSHLRTQMHTMSNQVKTQPAGDKAKTAPATGSEFASPLLSLLAHWLSFCIGLHTPAVVRKSAAVPSVARMSLTCSG